MEIKLKENTLIVRGVDAMQYGVIRSWGCMKWDKKTKSLHGMATLELLDRLAGMVRLPPTIEAHRTRLHSIQDAVDRERVKPSPAPLCDYPVTTPLYAHQTRAANMALLTFGWAEPQEARHE